jgi:hypothetical protein
METLEKKARYEAGLTDYVSRERSAVDLLNSVGQLMYGQGVELVFFRNHLLDINTSEVIKLFDYAETVVNKPIDVATSAEVARGLLGLDLAPSKIDLGRLTHEFPESGKPLPDFLNTPWPTSSARTSTSSARRTWCSTASGASAAWPRAS